MLILIADDIIFSYQLSYVLLSLPTDIVTSR